MERGTKGKKVRKAHQPRTLGQFRKQQGTNKPLLGIYILVFGIMYAENVFETRLWLSTRPLYVEGMENGLCTL